MPKYLFQSRYTVEGAKAMAKEGGTARRAAIAKATEAAGGKLEAFYYAFGGVDVFAIADVPDNVTAAAMALAVTQGGAATTNTVVLLTPEEMDKVVKKTMAYRPPGH